MTLTIARKLFLIGALGCAALICVMVITLHGAASIQQSVQSQADASHYAMSAKDLQFHCTQVQQWLTDISATRGLEGFDDGFEMAEEHARLFEETLNKFEEQYKTHNNADRVLLVREIRDSFGIYHQTGKRLAQAYIDGGPEKGNAMMKEFDVAAEQINDQLVSIATHHQNLLQTSIDEATSESLTNQRMVLATGSLGTLALVVFSLLISRSITKPLRQTISALKNISEGDGDLTRRLDGSRQDELGELATQFNAFATSVQSIIHEIAQQAAMLSHLSEDLHGVAKGNLSETAELMTQSDIMSTSATQVGDMMQESGSGTCELSDNSKRLADTVSELTACIADIAKSAERASSVAGESADLVGKNDESISRLHSAATEIGRVVDVIQEIAEQTNLLALNATIEAARAGEAGKGFAVVATEVKELAKQTANATIDIRKRIAGIQECSEQVVSSMDSIGNSISNVDGESKAIAAAVEQQSISAQEISQNVEQSASVAQSVAKRVQQSADLVRGIMQNSASVDNGVKSISESAARTRDASSRLTDVTDSLQSIIGRYKSAVNTDRGDRGGNETTGNDKPSAETCSQVVSDDVTDQQHLAV
ncbi:Methyl-accepting chemotaxis protein 4 [Planctomycetes bacterium CA13]|uniref:Methyl-accepting chemotaxis protein 4 n=1 Tax=Novipirellula herctigrandis TaxID=2527986 RepID=A0A5C5YUK8_9BACT|nr:Methyl-accepting chemotaxis protein 4 [Planctomycetes bacterium CA13]